MSTLRLLSTLLLTTMHWAISLIAMGGLAFGQIEPVAKPQRDPIRVGGNVQESKLIARVEPVYPAEAQAARISGVVILQATINEKGEVWDVKVLRGHPLLDQAAADAVKQWRYSPTRLNGEPVPVIATVTVTFDAAGNTSPPQMIMDESGNLLDSKGQVVDAQALRQMKSVLISPSPKISFKDLENHLRNLQRLGIEDIQLVALRFYEGRLFYRSSVTTLNPDGSTHTFVPGKSPIQGPELALNMQHLSELAMQTRPTSGFSQSEMPQSVSYQVFMTETGEIVGIQQVVGPKLAEVEAEILRTRVIMPGRRGSDPVPVTFDISMTLRWHL